MKVAQNLDKMIAGLARSKTPAEYIIMGKKYFYDWIIEITRTGDITLSDSRKHKYSHKGIKIIICESDILEVVPNAKYLLE